MSAEYDNYLNEHIGNVATGLNWMLQNLPGRLFNQSDFELALSNAEQHDNSKYSIEEYPAYDAYFYGGEKTQEVKDDFDYAWLHHQNGNPHHWQFWVLIEDDKKNGGGLSLRALEMPLCYVYEMIADWWTFSWRNNNLMEIFEWYDGHREVMVLHEKTREVVEKILTAMYEVLSNQARLEHSDIDYAAPGFIVALENAVTEGEDV